MRPRSRGLRLAGVVLVSLFGLAACGSGPKPLVAATSPPAATSPAAETIASCVDEAQQRTNGITLQRADNADTVDAMAYGSGESAVIFANEVRGDLCRWQPGAQALAAKGYLTVVFNYSTMAGAQHDVLAAVAKVRERGARKVFLVGASMGGTAVLVAAGLARPPVTGVVSLSAPKEFGDLNALGAMATFGTPVLFIAGKDDRAFAADARTLYGACTAKDKKLEIRDGGDHGVALVDAAVTAMIEQFLSSH